ncbi:unnamed protein product [Prunus armeniaca]
MDQEERSLWSPIAHGLGFHWRYTRERASSVEAMEGTLEVAPRWEVPPCSAAAAGAVVSAASPVGGTVVRGGGATMSIAGSWVEWLWAVSDLAIAAILPLVFLLPTTVVWKASMDWKIGGTDSLSTC